MDPMNDAGLERDIERALAIDPSPEFVARVRTRVADEPSPASLQIGWLFAGAIATAVAAASAIAIFVLSPTQPHSPPNAPILASRSITSSIVVPDVGPAAGPAKAGHYVLTATGRDDSNRYVVSGFSRTDATAASEPLFDPRETAALQRLIAGVRDARVDLAPLLKEPPMAPRSLDDLVIPLIAIEPLVPGGVEGERP
jgi:hypothetical protein